MEMERALNMIGIIAVAAALPRLLPYWTPAGTVWLYACRRDKDPRNNWSNNKSVSVTAAEEEAVFMEVASLVVVVVVVK
jgi:hypothetical protein